MTMGRALAPRRLDQRGTLDNYERRLRSMPREIFLELDGAWLETFDVYGAFREVGVVDCPAMRLLDVAREHGANVHGVISARTREGRYVCADVGGIPREQLPLVYVGPRNSFSGRCASKFALRHEDKVFETDT